MSEEKDVATSESVPTELVPASNFINYYLGEGYELAAFTTRKRDEAKLEAVRLRKIEGKLSAYAPLLKGFFGVFVKDAPAREAKIGAKKEEREPVQLEIEGFSGTTKEARAFARRLIEEARNAEFEADMKKSKEAKEVN